MSDNLPFDIQEAIIERLPVESLIRFRSVSKRWKSLIESSRFILAYHSSSRHTQVHRLLIRYSKSLREQKYVSIVDDDTIPRRRQKPKVDVTPPFEVKMFDYYNIVGCSQGLFCLHGGYFNDCDDSISPKKMAIIWNITARKEVFVVLPNVGHGVYRTVLGFGVCSKTLDPKILKINQLNNGHSAADSVSCIPWQAEVFTLSTGVWRNPLSSSNLPRKSVETFGFQVIVEEILYWLANDRITMDGEIMSYILLISFDLEIEEFSEISLPDTLAHGQADENLNISKLRESPVVLECVDHEVCFVVWMMQDVVTKSFTKVFKIHTPDALIFSVYGFNKSGKALIEILERIWCNDDVVDSSLGVYNPQTEYISYLGNIEYGVWVSVYSYMETLLLLDQPDFIIYDKDESYISKQIDKKRLLKHTTKGKMKAVEETTEPFDNMLTGKTDKVKRGDPNFENWLELEQQNVDIKRKKLESDQLKVGLKKKKLELEQQRAELQKNFLELEQQNVDIKRKKLELYQEKVGLKKKKLDLEQQKAGFPKNLLELEQHNEDIKRKKLELDQQKVGLKKKKLELAQQRAELQKNLLELQQQKTDLKRMTLELEQQKVDLKNKKADLAPLFGDTSKMQNCSRHASSA